MISALKQVKATSPLLKIAKGKHKMPQTWAEVLKHIKQEWQ